MIFTLFLLVSSSSALARSLVYLQGLTDDWATLLEADCGFRKLFKLFEADRRGTIKFNSEPFNSVFIVPLN